MTEEKEKIRLLIKQRNEKILINRFKEEKRIRMAEENEKFKKRIEENERNQKNLQRRKKKKTYQRISWGNRKPKYSG